MKSEHEPKSELAPDWPAAKAARRILATRFDAVRAALGGAAELSADPEPVHQLRVATRRATSAISVFEDLLRSRLARRARRLLQRLRRSAAAARDSDVFLADLESWAPGRPNVEKPGIQFLLGHLLAERRAAQEPLAAAIAAAESAWRGRMARLVSDVRPRDRRTFAEHAAPIATALVRSLSQALDRADFDDPLRLHALRVAGKRVRYALEILAPALSSAVGPVQSDLAELQGILGRAHDNIQAIQRLDRLIDDLSVVRPHLVRLVRGGIHAYRSLQREQWASQRAAFAAWKSRRTAFRGIDLGR